ncbi:hypothetical protein [Eubacterium pyruvativorans]|uniref:hypothetical protein n=1 Tax=Eubacterium pyruvativorans TaxID=155865 RepID=UPI0013D43796|nr:hypothetical protein [Eubacterium pyruvativorans]
MLSDDKKESGDVKYKDGTYTMTVEAKGQKEGWSGAAKTDDKIKIGGIEVEPSTSGWIVSGTSEGDRITVTKK